MSVVLVLGAGPNIGQSVSDVFTTHGWRVASASRSRHDRLVDDTHLDLHVDLSIPESISAVFAKVEAHWSAPSAVIYNGTSDHHSDFHLSQHCNADSEGAKRTIGDPRDPLIPITLKQHEEEMTVNLTSAFVAAQQAVTGFRSLPASEPKVFFYTGNKLNVMPSPAVLTFGMGKTAAAHMIWDASVAYKDDGFRYEAICCLSKSY